jgi:phosphatidylinositol kinase/protein kinase (PI-3  family)
VDREGHLIHIDFGFMLTDSPGQGLEFEAASFKMTASFEQILQAYDGYGMKRFKEGMVNGLLALNKHAAKIILLV